MMPVRAVEQKPCGFDRRSAQHNDLAESLERLPRDLIDARHALRFAALLVDDDVTRYRVGPEREPSGLSRGRQRRSGTAEVGIGRTAAVAVPAVMTRSPAVVPLGQDRRAPDNDVPIFP